MAFKLALMLCALVAQAIGAPKPCVSGCYSTGGSSSSSTSYEAMSAIQSHGNLLAQQSAAFQQLHQNLLNSLHETQSKFDFSRPGTWHSPNAYRTPDGGQVYEEHGKIEGDHGRTQYFKQNYTNSWSSGNHAVDAGALSNQLVHGNGHGGYGGSYQNHQQVNWQGSTGHQRPERIEDFGSSQVDTQASQAVYESIIQMVRNLNNYITECTERVQQGTLSNYESYINVVQQHLERIREDIRQYGLYDRLITQVNSIETHLAELRRQAEYSSRVVHAPVAQQVAPGQPGYHHVTVAGESAGEINVHGSVPHPGLANANGIHYGQQATQQDIGSSGSYGPGVNTLGNSHSGIYGTSQQTGQSSTWQSTHGGSHGGAWQTAHGGNQAAGWGATHAQLSTVQQPVKTVHDEWHASGSHKETVYHPQVQIQEPYTSGCAPGTWCANNGGQTEVISGCSGRAYGTLCKRYKRDYHDLSQQTEDLTQQTEDLTQQTEDLTQQTEDLTQQTEDLTQQTEDLTQQTEDLTQQHVGSLQRGNHRNQGGYHETDSELTDFTQQQQTGGLEFGNQYNQRQNRHEQHGHNDGDSYSQGFGQHHGHEHHGHNDGDKHDQGFGQHHHGHNDGDNYNQGFGPYHGHEQHGHRDGDSTHNHGFGDYSQQQSGNFESENTQQHQHEHHHRDHHEHDNDRHHDQDYHHPDHEHHHRHRHNDSYQGTYTQQTQGFGDYSQQQNANQHGGYAQQNGGFTQQTQEFGHGGHSGFTQQSHDLTQQTQGFEDLTQQQTVGHLQFGQRPTGATEIGDLNRNPHQNGYHDGYTQQTQGFEDLTQQQSFDNLHQQKPDHLGGFTQQTEDLTQQTQGFEDLTQQQSFGNLQSGNLHQQVQKPDHFGSYTQQTEDLTQQTQGFEDLTQQQSFGNLQSGNLHHQKHDHLEGFTQQTEDLTQQTQGFEDLTQQQTVGHVQFGQRPTGATEIGDLNRNPHQNGYHDGNTQQTQGFDDLTQQQSFGNLHQQKPDHLGGFTQQTEDLTQQQSFGNLQSGNLHQQVQKPDHFGGYTQQTEDLTQQTQEFEGLTQQQSFGNLQSGNLHQQKPDHLGGFTQQTEDLTQQTQGFEDLTQQQSFGNLQLGSLHQQVQKPDHFGGYTQQTEDLTQQTQGFEGFSQQQTGGNVPLGQQQPTGHGFGNYNQHPKDLTQQGYNGHNQQSQGFSHQSQTLGGSPYQTSHEPTINQLPNGLQFGQQHQPGPGQINQQIPAPKPPARHQIGQPGDTQPVRPISGVKGGKRPFQQSYPQQIQNSNAPGVIPLEEQAEKSSATQWHTNHQPGDLTNENFQGRSNDNSQSTVNQQTNSTDTDILFQPRIIEAYGGKSPYNVHHSNSIFDGVKPNPTATLAPLVNAWDIREKPNDVYHTSINQPTFAGVPARPTQTTTTTSEWSEPEISTTTPAPGFWNRVGNKITTTFEKTKEKIGSVFG